MSNLEYSHYEGYGDYAFETYRYSQAVRVPPNRVECSGQGGWDPKTGKCLETWQEQIDQAFANVDLTLKTAGVKDGFKSVFSIKSYHVGTIDSTVLEAMIGNLKKYAPGHKPIWTMLGVATLALPEMKVEIDVVAIDEK
ncbi:hypothetical protein LTR78_009793 [Recurvomyces mirabilis]|uniref:Uncharacterized protein n=1 Tax=Recurvomyces mirabilis TaxID=574656 RepID=A0AAE0TNY9_9PEZI|nr:hypothetical protein LTR78_009793 [Recurvomyces mirabilis]KAK5158210.1 hypothetical protein LTS14_003228 [Recurvomyces mirabilis]